MWLISIEFMGFCSQVQECFLKTKNLETTTYSLDFHENAYGVR